MTNRTAIAPALCSMLSIAAGHYRTVRMESRSLRRSHVFLYARCHTAGSRLQKIKSGGSVTPVDAEQLKVRPALRILGAVFMLLIAALMVQNAIPFFFAEQVLLPSCVREIKASSRLLCEVDKAMRSAVPPQMQGPIEALLHLTMAALLIFLSWLLTKPLFGRFGKMPS